MSFSPLSPAAASAPQVSDAGSSSASIPASAASSQATNRQPSDRQYFLQYLKIDDRQRCTLCNMHWSKTTSSTVIGEHFESKHKKVFASRPRAAPSVHTIHTAFNNQEGLSAFDDIVELFIHHPAMPLSLSGSKYFRKVLKSSSRCTHVSVRQAILEKDQAYLRHNTIAARGL